MPDTTDLRMAIEAAIEELLSTDHGGQAAALVSRKTARRVNALAIAAKLDPPIPTEWTYHKQRTPWTGDAELAYVRAERLRAFIESLATVEAAGRNGDGEWVDPIPVIDVAAKVGMKAGRPDHLAERLKRRGCRVAVVGRRNTCERADAAKLFPQKRKRIEEIGNS